ncbi:MAG: hypothetical protein KAW52_08885 [candidate division Zixibacteria bacterium]|nr:hypothetical protein [candidate division Zixibacteria bacterium]
MLSKQEKVDELYAINSILAKMAFDTDREHIGCGGKGEHPDANHLYRLAGCIARMAFELQNEGDLKEIEKATKKALNESKPPKK